jgi:hypothetical protein
MVINCVFSQHISDVIVEQNNNFIATIGIPDGWVAVRNTSLAKGSISIYIYRIDNLNELLQIFVSVYMLNGLRNLTEQEFNEYIEDMINGRYEEANRNSRFGHIVIYDRIEYYYNIAENVITYNSNHDNYDFSRLVYVHYRNYCIGIILGTHNERLRDELIITVDEIVNSLTFHEKL